MGANHLPDARPHHHISIITLLASLFQCVNVHKFESTVTLLSEMYFIVDVTFHI